jgi:hypothetical protein
LQRREDLHLTDAFSLLIEMHPSSLSKMLRGIDSAAQQSRNKIGRRT